MKLHVTSGVLNIYTDLTNVKSVIKTCIDAGYDEITIRVDTPPAPSKFKVGDQVIDLAWESEGLASNANPETIFTVTEIRSKSQIDSGSSKYQLEYIDDLGNSRIWFGNDEDLKLVKK